MSRDSRKTAICRIAAIRTQSAYVVEKAKLIGELREARQRGEDPKTFLEAQEKSALVEALGVRSR